MAFRTGVSLGDGFIDAKNQARWIKGIMGQAVTSLAGNADSNFIFQLTDNLRAAIAMLTADSAVPGMGSYAQNQYNDATYNVGAEFTSMVNALNACVSWIVTNFPKDGTGKLLSHTFNADNSGARVPVVFTSAQTAGLTSALNAAIATIS